MFDSISPPVPLRRQEWATYTTDDHRAWSTLVLRRMETLQRTGAAAVLSGIRQLGLTSESVPHLDVLNTRLTPLAGWQVVAVDGYLDAATFFGLLATRRFPSTMHVRSIDSLEYIPSPDIFHDVFGHVPMHADPVFADLLQRLGILGAAALDADSLVAVQRLFWYTVEFGLIRENGQLRVYGSGLVSSIAEERQALFGSCERRPFELATIVQTPFDVDHVQPMYFVLDDFDQLRHAIEQLEMDSQQGS